MNLPIQVTDDERQELVGRLCRACGQGLFTLDEFEQRVERAYNLASRTDFDSLAADLPAEQTVVPASVPGRSWSVSLLGGSSHRGRWTVAPRFVQLGLIGSSDLDLGVAALSSPNTTITVVSLIGSTTVRVPDHVSVQVSGFSVLGSKTVDPRDALNRPDAPTVHLRIFSLLGSARVRSSR
jgi:Domain of unknown function (DUF1707)/Cell wall-active antibiotics response 4TMS YvqF